MDSMNELEDKFYPELDQNGKDQAQELMNSFKLKLADCAKNVFDDFYCDVTTHIESDSWQNFRTDIINGIQGYTEHSKKYPHDYSRIRESIIKNHREELIKDLDIDNLKEIEKLKRDVKRLEQELRDRRF